MGKTKRILKGKFPEEHPSLDDQVRISNRAAERLVDADGVDTPEGVMNEINNLALWLGGIHPDVQVYAWQLIRRVKGIEVFADDKTHVRLAPLEDKIFRDTPYEATTYAEIAHFSWPKQWLDESTFEDRLDALAEEYASEDSPVDMLLSGMSLPEDLDFNQRFQLTQDCLTSLGDLYRKYGKPNVLFNERLDRFMGWLLTVEHDFGVYAGQHLFAVQRLTTKPDELKNWSEFSNRFCNDILGVGD